MSETVVALATMHGKLEQIAPAFERLPDWRLVVADIDTDQFGTFSGEIERVLSPSETAIAKARAGMAAAGTAFGLASEGSIRPHPALPFVPINTETLALVDAGGTIALVETHSSSDIQAVSIDVAAGQHGFEPAVDELARRLDLPTHGAIACGMSSGQLQCVKGIRTAAELAAALGRLQSDGARQLRVENDYRAMYSPSRQCTIAQCAQQLVDRISSTCPDCGQFGWGRIDIAYGLPCSFCFTPAPTVPRADIFGCVQCPSTRVVARLEQFADPARCDVCNP